MQQQVLASLVSILLLAFASALLPRQLEAQHPIGSGAETDYSGHFRVFTGAGEPATLEDIVQAMDGVDAVMVGETHTDPVGHWIESELFQAALERAGIGQASGAQRTVALSLEMFESDVQWILDEYLQGLITEAQFKSSARPWEHYDEDYRPMVEMARRAGVPVLAANAPRRYVNRVSRLGPDALGELSRQARSYLPPLPYPPPSQAYREEWTNLMSTMVMEPRCPPPEGEETAGVPLPEEETPPHPPMNPHRLPSEEAPSHRGGSFMENGLMAQALWDASMAHTITTFLDSHPGALVLHMVGGFHVKNFTGIPEKVEFYRPGTRSLVVHMDLAEDFESFDPSEHAGRGDFVILTDQALDLDYQRNCVEG